MLTEHEHHIKTFGKNEALCGTKLEPTEWVFADITHAYQSLVIGSLQYPCKKCAMKVVKTFTS